MNQILHLLHLTVSMIFFLMFNKNGSFRNRAITVCFWSLYAYPGIVDSFWPLGKKQETKNKQQQTHKTKTKQGKLVSVSGHRSLTNSLATSIFLNKWSQSLVMSWKFYGKRKYSSQFFRNLKFTGWHKDKGAHRRCPVVWIKLLCGQRWSCGTFSPHSQFTGANLVENINKHTRNKKNLQCTIKHYKGLLI